MPSRKSNVSTISNGPEEVVDTPNKSSKDKDGLSVDDLSLPKSMIARLAKGVLPANTQIHKDALLALHKSATVFVSYIASNSNDNAQASGKKTISPQDVIAALKDAELEEFLPRLEAELKKYNDTQCDKRNTYRRKVKEEKAAAAQQGDTSEGPQDDELAKAANGAANGHADTGDAGAERPVKKVKRENGVGTAPTTDDADEDGDDEEGQESDENDDEDEAAEESDENGDGNEDDDEEDDDEDDDDEEDEEDEDGQDESMEDPLEEDDNQSASQDEALDEPDSD